MSGTDFGWGIVVGMFVMLGMWYFGSWFVNRKKKVSKR